MEYNETDFLTPNLKTELENIKNYFNYINQFTSLYEIKNKKIDEKILSLSGNNYLDDNSSLELLKYQKNIIKNEKQYLDNLNNIFKSELNKQIYMVSEKSIIMFMSFVFIASNISLFGLLFIKCKKKRERFFSSRKPLKFLFTLLII